MRASPFSSILSAVVSLREGDSAVLHWDVKKMIPLLLVAALAIIALVVGCMDASSYGIYW